MKYVIFTSCLVTVAVLPAFATEPGFTLIEPPGGLTGTTVSDISADGKYVVGRSFASPMIRGFIWSNGVREDLVHPESYDTSSVSNISDDGQTMVAYFGRFVAPYYNFWYFGPSSGPYFDSWAVPRDYPNHVIYGMSGDGSTVYGRWSSTLHLTPTRQDLLPSADLIPKFRCSQLKFRFLISQLSMLELFRPTT